MGTIHRYTKEFTWEGVETGQYPSGKEMSGVSVRWLIGPAEQAGNFALRYFEVEPGGWTSLDRHDHDHGVFVLRGRGTVLLDQGASNVSFGDVIYIPPNQTHQLRNAGDEPFGFLCIIPPKEMRE